MHAAILGKDIAFYSKPPEACTLWDEQEEVQKTQEVKIVQDMKGGGWRRWAKLGARRAKKRFIRDS